MSKNHDIDWAFIAKHEGARITKAYVPGHDSKSGVTIATGVDLGQRHFSEVNTWDIPNELKSKLKDYCGLCGPSAVSFLQKSPLHISEPEAEALDSAAADPIFTAVGTAYDADAGAGAFKALPREMRTVIASVAYQYGPNLKRRAPKFWAKVTAKDWPAVVLELRNFGDAYKTRRNDEANYIQTALDKNNA